MTNPKNPAMSEADECRELLPCPFCGNKAEVDRLVPAIEPNRRRIVCVHCGACSPLHDTIQMAAGHWNNRRQTESGGLAERVRRILKDSSLNAWAVTGLNAEPPGRGDDWAKFHDNLLDKATSAVLAAIHQQEG